MEATSIVAEVVEFVKSTKIYEALKMTLQQQNPSSMDHKGVSLEITPFELTTQQAIDHFMKVAIHLDCYPILQIDEANEVFTAGKRGTDVKTTEMLANTKKTLEVFTQLTKQDRKLSVVLISSEPAFAFMLADNFGFSVSNFPTCCMWAKCPQPKSATARRQVRHG